MEFQDRKVISKIMKDYFKILPNGEQGNVTIDEATATEEQARLKTPSTTRVHIKSFLCKISKISLILLRKCNLLCTQRKFVKYPKKSIKSKLVIYN